MDHLFGEEGYLWLLQDILENGIVSTDRTGVGTRRVFGRTLKFDLGSSFPLLTTKKVWFKGILRELLWLISGETNIRPLVLSGVNIWNEWPLKRYLAEKGVLDQVGINTPAWQEQMQLFIERIKVDEEFAGKYGDLGPVYGKQWRAWTAPDGRVIDQLGAAIATIKAKPDSRRIIVNAWNVSDLAEMEVSGLPPCHLYYQFAVLDGKLNCVMLQRSVDSFLGLPFNIASYALLTYAVANVTGLVPGELTLFLGDTHIYLNHTEAVRTQISRTPFAFPQLAMPRQVVNIDDLTENDFQLIGYQAHDRIEAEIAV